MGDHLTADIEQAEELDELGPDRSLAPELRHRRREGFATLAHAPKVEVQHQGEPELAPVEVALT